MTYEFADGMLVVCTHCGESELERYGVNFRCQKCNFVMGECELTRFEIANYAALLRRGITMIGDSGSEDFDAGTQLPPNPSNQLCRI